MLACFKMKKSVIIQYQGGSRHKSEPDCPNKQPNYWKARLWQPLWVRSRDDK